MLSHLPTQSGLDTTILKRNIITGIALLTGDGKTTQQNSLGLFSHFSRSGEQITETA